VTPITLLSGRARSGKDTAAQVLCERYGGVAIAFADPIKRFMELGFGLTVEQLWGYEKEMEFHRDAPDPSELFDALMDAIAPLDLDEYLGDDGGLERDFFDEWLKGLPAKTTPRHMMQTFGTEVIRKEFGPDFWLDLGLMITDALLIGRKGYTPEGGIFDSEKSVNHVVITDGRFRNEVLAVKQMAGRAVRIVRPDEKSLSDLAKAHSSETEMLSMPDEWFDAVIVNSSALEDFRTTVRRWAF
jgi:hypothetical protein